MVVSLRIRLAVLYATLVALTLVGFATVAYVTVSNELYQNLDASLSRAGASLLAVLRKEQGQIKRPLAPARRTSKKAPSTTIGVLERSSAARDFVGPVLPDTDQDSESDPVWSAVYEHMLLNSSAYLMQVVNSSGYVAWRSDNMDADSIPTFSWFVAQGAQVIDGRIYTYYWLRGTRYRVVLTRGDVAEVAAAYPAEDVDATLRELFSLLLFSLPIVLALSLLLGWIVARRSLRPVDVITNSARQITASNLGLRLPASTTNDELGRLTDTLNEMIARLETSFAQIRQFTSDASHELKTPLAILMGELDLALRKPLTSDEYVATMKSCLEEVDRLTHVVQGLLDLSRAETGQVNVARDPVRLSSLVENVCDDVMIIVEKKKIDLRTNISPGVSVMGDKVRLHQAILNVVENAVKYTPDGGSVRIELQAAAGVAQLVVADTGIGIPASELPHIYDRFFRVDKSRSTKIQGTGLGLAIVKWIVDAHNGSIDTISSPGRGTTVAITLPLVGRA